ncbi:glycoside hydrolase family 3 C-terminal domain-containing protein [Herbiconiux sp. A18JL235]|uniref:beta-glucosidase n=1 Tax=Herbiconiux sp. A18JL235 TaxID=3152363 RepID=A0AB39BHZ6_9MICO
MHSRRIEQLLESMSLDEKLGQLNMPLSIEVGAEPGAPLPPADADEIEAFARGEFHPDLGPGGGFFQLSNLAGATAETQARFFNELQAVAARTRLGVPVLQIAEGTHGFSAPGATIFPEGPALGSSWNPALVREVYAAVAREARSVGVHVLCTLVIEPTRDPRLGRSCEGYTEDPYLASVYAAAIVAGAQGDDLSDPESAGVVLCHFPGQSQPESGLERGAMHISERQLRSVFLPPWERGLREGKALSVMATYAAIDGMPTHGSTALLTDLLREELAFEGIVLSEGYGFKTLVYEGVAADQKEAGRLAITAGVDVNITYEEAYLSPLKRLVLEGAIDETLIDRAVSRVLSVKERLGLFENATVDPERARAVLGCEAHADLALRAARESIVLLRNRDGVLPLDRDGLRIAVIGPNADNALNQLGDYTMAWQGLPIDRQLVSVLEGIRSQAAPGAEVVYARGCAITGDDRSGFAEAVAAAREADVAVVVVGEQIGGPFPDDPAMWPTVGEGADVADLDLSGVQEELVLAVHETGTPVVVVLVNGRPLSIPRIDETAAAIVEAWLPGEAGGRAVADILFGSHEPMGRMSLSVPRHAGQLPVHYNHDAAKTFQSELAQRYVDMPYTPLYVFGEGLAYTEFSLEGLTLAAVGDDAFLAVSFTVTNTGSRAGHAVPQIYVRDLVSSSVPLSRELAGFASVLLAPGESRLLTVGLDERAFATLQPDGSWVVEPGEFIVMACWSSAETVVSLRVSAELSGEIVTFSTSECGSVS